MSRVGFPILLLLLGIGVYVALGARVGSLSAEFYFDDYLYIKENPAIQSLWPIDGHRNRPVLTTSLTLNNLLFGMEPRGFRLTNIAIHITAALLLYGLVRRSLRLPVVRGPLRSAAGALAFTIAALWMLHPIQTQAVTYIWQRSESMMGMFFLATLYCTLRCAEGKRTRLWGAAAVLCCMLGLGTKEVMAAVFPILLLYDGILLAPSFREALRRRWGLYAVLGTIAALLLIVVLPGTLTSHGIVDRWSYAGSQPGIILKYLRLAIWPHPLCFDYGVEPTRGVLAIALPTAIIGALLLATLWGLRKRSWLGLAGAWFFLILAPTSSFVVINDLMVEYRMYLPLVAVITVLVLGCHAARRHLRVPLWILASLAILVLGVLTVQRNRVYGDGLSLWQSAVETAPWNSRAHCELGNCYFRKAAFAEAQAHYRKALELKADNLNASWNLALCLQNLGEFEGAIAQHRESLKFKDRAHGHCAIADLLYKLERYDEAVSEFERAIEIMFYMSEAHLGLAKTLYALKHYDRALAASREALKYKPADPEAWFVEGNVLNSLGEHKEAVQAYQNALRHAPGNVSVHCNLGGVMANLGDYSEALRHYQIALRLNPGLVGLLSRSAREAATSPSAVTKKFALQLGELAAQTCRRQNPEVLANLALAYASAGQVVRAEHTFREVLSLPAVVNDPQQRRLYGQQLAALRRGDR